MECWSSGVMGKRLRCHITPILQYYITPTLRFRMATLKLEIVTPEAKTYSDDVDMVVIPGVEGELGVLPQHVPLMTQLKPGELKITKQGQDSYLAVGEGFVEIT